MNYTHEMIEELKTIQRRMEHNRVENKVVLTGPTLFYIWNALSNLQDELKRRGEREYIVDIIERRDMKLSYRVSATDKTKAGEIALRLADSNDGGGSAQIDAVTEDVQFVVNYVEEV